MSTRDDSFHPDLEALEPRVLLAAAGANVDQLFGAGSVLAVGGTVFFVAADSAHGAELFATEGAKDGVRLVKDIRRGSGSSTPADLTDLNGLLVFTADDGLHGRELWTSDGTERGTVMLKDIRTGGVPSNPSSFVELNGALIFIADDGGSGRELWTTDGTPGGTHRLKDIRPGPQTSAPADLILFQPAFGDDLVFFTADDGTAGRELWRTDGTAQGTVRVRDIRAGRSGSDPVLIAGNDGSLFFTADDGVHGRELWASDGTAGGTFLIRDIRPGRGFDPAGFYLADTGGALFFTADDGVHGREPWAASDSPDEAAPLGDLRPGPQGSDARDFFAAPNGGGSRLFFTADDGMHGRELWVVPGGTDPFDGPALLVDLRPGPQGSNPTDFTDFNGDFLFRADDGVHGEEPLLVADGDNFISGQDINPGPAASNPREFTVDPDTGALYFAATGATGGRELWTTDAGLQNPRRVKDINPGAASSSPTSLVFKDGVLYFTALDRTGPRVWMSDGTEEGTVPLFAPTKVAPPPLLADPFAARSYASFFDTEHGTSLLALRTVSPVTLPTFAVLPGVSVLPVFDVLPSAGADVVLMSAPLTSPNVPGGVSTIPPSVGLGYFFIDTDFQIKPRPMFILR